jgi:hypothetical protein
MSVIKVMILVRDEQPMSTMQGREMQTCCSRDEAVDVSVLEHARKFSCGMMLELAILTCRCVERLLSTCNAAILCIRSSLLGFGYSRSGSFDLTIDMHLLADFLARTCLHRHAVCPIRCHLHVALWPLGPWHIQA